ncbi:MAG TPA: hypothetical protein VGE94_13965 [Chloroflexota bacterium]
MLSWSMALSLHQVAPRPDLFERHIRRLAWYTLLASAALLIPIVRTSASPDLGLVGALAALVIVIAVLAVIRDVRRYVQAEQVRRREATLLSQHAGACSAAATIQDRISNLLSITVGYVELVAETERLSPLAHEQAERAIQSALAASRAVSVFKESLDCHHVSEPQATATPGSPPREIGMRLTFRPGQTWSYDPQSRTIQTEDGAVVATVSANVQRSSALTAGQLLSASMAMWDVLGDAQHLGMSLLADGLPDRSAEVELRTLLERINALAAHAQP